MANLLSQLGGRPPQQPNSRDMQQAKLRLLREADIFRDLTPADMADIERLTTMTTCRRGRVLYEPEAQAEVLFILKRGKVQIYRLTSDGRRLVTATLEAGSVFGEMPLLSQSICYMYRAYSHKDSSNLISR